MPKLWTDTIESHRKAVRQAALDAVPVLAAQAGLAAVTMSAVSAATGIGRATLYKYFPDSEALLLAWHERQVLFHVQQLAALTDHGGGFADRLDAVLVACAQMAGQGRGTELAAFLHRGAHMDPVQQQVLTLIAELLRDGVAAGEVRGDVSPEELARFCLHGLSAAAGLDQAALRRLVRVVSAGLRPEH